MSKQTKCPKCHGCGADCYDSRPDAQNSNQRVRRYKCFNCMHTWATIELGYNVYKRMQAKIRRLT